MNAKRIVAGSVLAICIGAVLFLLIVPFWAGWLLQSSMKETYKAVASLTLPCESGTAQTIEPWSKGGYSISCRRNGVKDGPWQGWEAGHISISGYYANGKEQGTWLVYALDGNQVDRTISYESGKEISNVLR